MTIKEKKETLTQRSQKSNSCPTWFAFKLRRENNYTFSIMRAKTREKEFWWIRNVRDFINYTKFYVLPQYHISVTWAVINWPLESSKRHFHPHSTKHYWSAQWFLKLDLLINKNGKYIIKIKIYNPSWRIRLALNMHLVFILYHLQYCLFSQPTKVPVNIYHWVYAGMFCFSVKKVK